MVGSVSWERGRVGPIGADFGARAIRLLQLADSGNGQLAVLHCAQQPVPIEVSSRGEYEQFLKSIGPHLLSQGRFVGREVVTALDWDDLQVHNLRIPATADRPAAEMIRAEAERLHGIDPARTEYQFLPAGDVRQGTELCQELIYLGVDRAVIDAHLNLLTALGLHPVAIDAGPCAVFRGFERYLRRGEDLNKVNVFVDMGYRSTRLLVTRGADPIYFKASSVGGRRFDELLSEQLGLNSRETAELRTRLNRQFRDPPAAAPDGPEADLAIGENLQRAIFDTLRPALEQLGEEIKLCLRYCSATFRGIRSDVITAVGGEAYNRDVVQFLSDHLRVPFRVGRPLQNINTARHFESMDRRSGQPEWATAAGLALKSPFLNPENRPARSRSHAVLKTGSRSGLEPVEARP